MSLIANTTDAIWEAIQRVSPSVTREEIRQLLLLSARVGAAERAVSGMAVSGVNWRDAALRRDETLDIAFAAAQASTSEIPAIVTGLDVLMMGAAEYEKIRKSGHWVSLYNQDAMINLEHPDVRRALANAD